MSFRKHRWAISGRCADCGALREDEFGGFCPGPEQAVQDFLNLPPIDEEKFARLCEMAGVKQPEPDLPEFTGGSVSYYAVRIEQPVSGGDPYTAECLDIIEALGMDYAEGNAFKAIWRRCAARMDKLKKGYDDGLYDAEKTEFYGRRMVEISKRRRENSA